MNEQQMKPIQLWAWALTGKDGDAELETAVSYYHMRFGKRPLLVYCPESVSLEPVDGPEIEPHTFGSSVLYFAVNGKEV